MLRRRQNPIRYIRSRLKPKKSKRRLRLMDWAWDKSDLRLIDSSRWPSIRDAWKNCPYIIDIHFVAPPRDVWMDDIQEKGQVNRKWADNILKYNIRGRKDAITVVYTNNQGASKIPMTPWIMAHRLSHGIRLSSKHKDPKRVSTTKSHIKYWSRIPEVVWELFDEIAENFIEVTKLKTWKNKPSDANFRSGLAHALGTMRSARQKKLRYREGEFLHELFAQYVIEGGVTLNWLPEKVTLEATVISKKYPYGDYRPVSTTRLDYDRINDLILSTENKLNRKIFPAIFENSIGEVIMV